jgi:hypothetical protein
MGVFRVFPQKDSWITNQILNNDLDTTATGSNHGRSPALNVFAQRQTLVSASSDLGRTLIQFDLTELSGKIYSDLLIPSSSVTYLLKMFNMRHDDTVPTSYDLFAYPLSRSWDEGTGIDDDNHTDDGVVNWQQPISTADWVATGSDFLNTLDYGSGSQHFDRGDENLEVDISDLVINWLTGGLGNNGVVIKLGSAEEDSATDYYRKVFHGRETKFIDRIPHIEARWEKILKDHRNNFAYDQDSNLYLYNFVRGELANLSEPVIVKIRDNLKQVSASFSQELTASRADVGVYSASFNVMLTESFSASWNDVWFSGSKAYMTGTFRPLVLTSSQVDPYDEFTVNVTNLKRVYDSREEARITVNVRKRDWVTHLGSIHTASLATTNEYVEKMYYSIIDDETGETIIPFGTGSVAYTQTSYNKDGNYFNLWMNNFVPGFKYRLKFLIDINQNDKQIVDEGFVFKVK